MCDPGQRPAPINRECKDSFQYLSAAHLRLSGSDRFRPVPSHTSNLEPNGFLQWEDTSKNTHSRYIETTETFLNGYEEFLALTGIKFG
jgi:hypothetical protein